MDALGLLLGAKGFAELIGTGAEKALVSGLFEGISDKRLEAQFLAAGLEFNPEELIIKREISSQGKSRAFIDNQLVPVSFLREIAPFLADVHGQNESQSLYEGSSQLFFLDTFSGVEALRCQVGETWAEYHEKWNRLQTLRKNEQQRLQMIDLLTFQINEIEKASSKGRRKTFSWVRNIKSWQMRTRFFSWPIRSIPICTMGVILPSLPETGRPAIGGTQAFGWAHR